MELTGQLYFVPLDTYSGLIGTVQLWSQEHTPMEVMLFH